MGKQSGFLMKQQQIQDNVMRAASHLTEQFMLDTLQIAISRGFGFGYARQKELIELWEAVRNEYRAAVDPKHPEADVAQEHMDREIQEIVKDNQEFYPFSERYPELRELSYEPKGGQRR